MSDEGQSERVEQLIGALRDDNEALRDHAIASLSQLGEEAMGPLIGLMADGWSEADILRNYPGVTRDDVIACLAYARDTLSSEKVFPSAA